MRGINAIHVGGTAIPLRRGSYLLRILKLFHSTGKTRPEHALLLALLARTRSKHAKELTESMGAVAALQALPKLRVQVPVKRLETPLPAVPLAAATAFLRRLFGLQSVVVYVPGDGRLPTTAAALLLNVPSSWKVYSIDPVSVYDVPAPLRHRLTCEAKRLEDFAVPASDAAAPWRLGVSVHSHAPLQGFYHSLPSPKACISIPCCAHYGLLSSPPLLDYVDNEIFSPRNHVLVWADP